VSGQVVCTTLSKNTPAIALLCRVLSLVHNNCSTDVLLGYDIKALTARGREDLEVRVFTVFSSSSNYVGRSIFFLVPCPLTVILCSPGR
jgi:hypothetical protein